MENVPKIVRDRLRVASVAAAHPDAEMLTAFAEQSLREAERATVLEHLAHCGECRDVVALALPATEEAAALVAPARNKWLAWPALRWEFALAGVVVIASFAIVHFQHRNPAMMAYKADRPAATEARNESLPAVALPPSPSERNKMVVPSASAKTADEERRASPTPAASAMNAPEMATGTGLVRAPLPHGPRPSNQASQFQQQDANAFAGENMAAPSPAPPPMAKQQASNQLAANVRVPVVAEGVAVQPSSVAAADASSPPQNLDLQNEAISGQPANYGRGEEKVGRAKEPTDTTIVHIEPEKTLATSSKRASSDFVFAASAARWAITSAGVLQRSLDQGNSWQDVNVKAGPAPPAGSSFEATSSTSVAKAKDAQNAGKKPNAPIVFRAVAANGLEVWAGGSAGQLYHSLDAGYHWNKVVPSAAGAVLTGDVVTLDFVDAQHGRVSTSTSEVWITADDGVTWQKQ